MKKKDIEEIRKALLTFYNERIFTSCALGFSKLDNNEFSTSRFFCGKTSDRTEAIQVSEETFFDVASLTKALVTIPCLLSLIKSKKLHFQQKLPSLLPYTVPKDKRAITLEQLISHRSGLPSHRQYFKNPQKEKISEDSENIARLILAEPLHSRPGEKYCYSDLDYILLGKIIEEKSGVKLADFWKTTIIEPLGVLSHYHLYDYKIKLKEKIFAETGCCPWSNIILQGIVHDDNCRLFGEISGHAGLFSTLDGILFLCNNILLNYLGKTSHPSFSNDDLRYLIKRRGSGKRALGFDVPTAKGSSTGSCFSFLSVGHLGYTGTSFWIDLEKQTTVVLLTNRVYFGEDKEGIQKMRPFVHDMVMKRLFKE